jgi:hypothetical protein
MVAGRSPEGTGGRVSGGRETRWHVSWRDVPLGEVGVGGARAGSWRVGIPLQENVAVALHAPYLPGWRRRNMVNGRAKEKRTAGMTIDQVAIWMRRR